MFLNNIPRIIFIMKNYEFVIWQNMFRYAQEIKRDYAHYIIFFY